MSKYRFIFGSVCIVAYLLIALFTALSSPVQATSTGPCAATAVPVEECFALLTLYHATTGPDWTNNTDWLTFNQPTAPCNWYGVICQNGHITGLQLSSNRLTGSLPPSLQHLDYLTQLLLDNNHLSGIVPLSLCHLTDTVTTADLDYNALYSRNTTVRQCLTTMDNDWLATQTIPPPNLQITQFMTDALSISWTPIPYQDDGGYYQIGVASNITGPFTLHGQTSSKADNSYLIDNLETGQTTYIQVRSFTPAHDNQPDDLTSQPTGIVGVTKSETNNILLMAYFPADNDLAGYIDDIVRRMKVGSSLNPNVHIALLVDGRLANDTRLLSIANGTITVTTAVFDQWGTHELDTADPDILAWFLTHARTNYPADIEIVSLLGHGVALVPEIEWSSTSQSRSSSPPSNPIPILPLEVDATPGDVTSRSYLSTIDVGQALATATQNGLDPFDIVFFDQCFQGNVDALYESRTTATYFIASPSYAWFAAPYNAYLTQLAPAATLPEMATAIIDRYQAALNDQHPNVIFWLSQSDITNIAQRVSDLGDALLQAVQAGVEAPILQAALNSQFVDTNQCQSQQFVMQAPDELIGAESFAQNLQQLFPANDPYGVQNAADALLTSLAPIDKRVRVGHPHLAPQQTWSYTNTITILAPLQRDISPVDAWRASIYRDEAAMTAVWTLDPTITTTLSQPFAFVQDGSWDEFLGSWYSGPLSPTIGNWCHYIPPVEVLAEDATTISLTLQNVNSTTVSLNWEAVTDDSATSYWLFIDGPATPSWTMWANYPLTQTTTMLSSLLPDHQYHFRLGVINDEGQFVAVSNEVSWPYRAKLFLPLLKSSP